MTLDTGLVWTCTLGGTNVLSYLLQGTKIQLDKDNTTGNDAELHIGISVEAVEVPEVGQEVRITRTYTDETVEKCFIGDVKRVSVQGNKYILSCKDKLNQYQYKRITKSYDQNIDDEGGEVSAIFADIATVDGFTADVESSGIGTSDITLNKFICSRAVRLERMKTLAKILDWVFSYSYDLEKVRLEPKAYKKISTVLSMGTNIYNLPRWDVNLEPMRNKLTIEGVYDEDTRIETTVASASQSVFTFTKTPEITKLTVDGTLQTLGIVGSTDSYDYIIDKEQKTFTFVTPLSGGESVVMEYTTRIPRPVIGTEPASITKYGVVQEDAFTFDDLATVEDAETRLTQLLAVLSIAPTNTIIQTSYLGIRPGNQVTVEDSSLPKYNGDYIVQKVTINYPEPTDMLEIGTREVDINKLFQTITERLRALETYQTSGDTELLRHLFNFYKNLELSKSMTFSRRKICDSYVIGHPVNGIIGISNLLDNFNTTTIANWTEGGTFSAPTRNSSDELTGTDCMETTTTGASATTGSLTSTNNLGDLSQYSGVSSGTPSKGTVGIWFNFTADNQPTAITLKIGSDSSNYAEISALAYASVDGYINWDNLTFTTQEGWNYFVFKLLNASITGTPDWTAIDYVKFDFTFTPLTGNETMLIDYLTISESNYIGGNGIGARFMEVT